MLSTLFTKRHSEYHIVIRVSFNPNHCIQLLQNMLRQNINSVQVNIFSMKVDVLNSEDIKVVILVFLSFRSCIVVIVTEVFRLASQLHHSNSKERSSQKYKTSKFVKPNMLSIFVTNYSSYYPDVLYVSFYDFEYLSILLIKKHKYTL